MPRFFEEARNYVLNNARDLGAGFAAGVAGNIFITEGLALPASRANPAETAYRQVMPIMMGIGLFAHGIATQTPKEVGVALGLMTAAATRLATGCYNLRVDSGSCPVVWEGAMLRSR